VVSREPGGAWQHYAGSGPPAGARLGRTGDEIRWPPDSMHPVERQRTGFDGFLIFVMANRAAGRHGCSSPQVGGVTCLVLPSLNPLKSWSLHFPQGGSRRVSRKNVGRH